MKWQTCTNCFCPYWSAFCSIACGIWRATCWYVICNYMCTQQKLFNKSWLHSQREYTIALHQLKPIYIPEMQYALCRWQYNAAVQQLMSPIPVSVIYLKGHNTALTSKPPSSFKALSSVATLGVKKRKCFVITLQKYYSTL